MPAFSKRALLDFTSASFPPPPPEATEWQPDPDSIARPGALPDRRFNRGPLEPHRRAAYKTEARQANLSAAASPSPSPEKNGMRSLRSWPAPVPRATGFPRDVIDIETSAFTSPNASVKKPASDTSSGCLSLGSKIAIAAERMDPVQLGTSYRPLTPGRQAKPTPKTDSPAKSDASDWAKKIGKAVADDESTAARVLSVPPHLRKHMGVGGGANDRYCGLNPTASTFQGKSFRDDLPADITKREADRLDDEMMALHLAAEEAGVGNEQRGQKLQEELLGQLHAQMSNSTSVTAAVDRGLAYAIREPVVATTHKRQFTYRHKELIMLIRAMEHELDLSKVVTARELIAMSDTDINSYYSKVRSAHKNWWEAEQLT